MQPSTLRLQTLTSAHAARHQFAITGADLDFVSSFADEPARDVALALGRTYFSILSMRTLIREGVTRTVREPAKIVTCSSCFTVPAVTGACLC